MDLSFLQMHWSKAFDLLMSQLETSVDKSHSEKGEYAVPQYQSFQNSCLRTFRPEENLQNRLREHLTYRGNML